jgi:hypothetical protein
LPHDIFAGEVVFALLQHLNEYLGRVITIYHAAVGPIAFGKILGEEIVKGFHTRIIGPLGIERVH